MGRAVMAVAFPAGVVATLDIIPEFPAVISGRHKRRVDRSP